jgi:hypothetical protein
MKHTSDKGTNLRQACGGISNFSIKVTINSIDPVLKVVKCFIASKDSLLDS